ncbi:hypothetical protein CLV56_1492 [Mumia flava]|uniref:VOC domain-containing protein n=1 Tax=Mumia flava TaxID=1348852 RepID=A0A0B2BNE7_9ACTN|nr:VOC family protein [Mumia flava]PJJ57265.1 hypothetical protein CLV56_1492 [Mumia flava]
MDQRLSFISVAVTDVARSRAFYVDGLGWAESMYVPGEVLMIGVADKVVLSLWDVDGFRSEVGEPSTGGIPPITLAHNVPTTDDVDSVFAQMVAAGGTAVAEPQARDWGGYTGYVADPDGYRWEIAYNPGPIGETVLP